MLTIDARWSGHFGIGRFSREVLARLTLNKSARMLRQGVRPASAFDALFLCAMLGSRKGVFYSPGFNVAFSSRHVQLATVHDLIHLEAAKDIHARSKLTYYERVLRPAIKNSRVVMTVSETSKTKIETWIADDDVEVVNVGNACSDIFTEDGKVFKCGQPYFLYVGTSKAHKNLSVVARALKHVPFCHLVVVTSDRLGVAKIISNSGVGSRTTILSRISDAELAALYRGATALLLPSTVEGFGLPAAEALSCGCPVLYFAGCQSVAEIVKTNGFAVDSSISADDWVDGMKAMLDRGRVSVSFRREMYAWSNVASNVDSVLARVTSN